MGVLNQKLMQDMNLFTTANIQIKKACINSTEANLIQTIFDEDGIESALAKLVDMYCCVTMDSNVGFMEQLSFNPLYTTLETQFRAQVPPSYDYYNIKIVNWQLIFILCTCKHTDYDNIINDILTKVLDTMQVVFRGALIN